MSNTWINEQVSSILPWSAWANYKKLRKQQQILATKTKRKRLTIFPERTREGHRQSDEQWDRFKGVIGETSETRIIMGFSECIDPFELNWTEQEKGGGGEGGQGRCTKAHTDTVDFVHLFT